MLLSIHSKVEAMNAKPILFLHKNVGRQRCLCEMDEDKNLIISKMRQPFSALFICSYNMEYIDYFITKGSCFEVNDK